MKNRIILWGTGKKGNEAYEYLSQTPEYSIAEICDSSITKIDSEFNGHIIRDINQIIEDNHKQDLFLLCADKWGDMFNFLISAGVSKERICCWDGSIRAAQDASTISIHSQDGEELFLREFFADIEKGVYIDVGAYNPVRFSNTQWAYLRGWRGINIEPNPDNIKLFYALRPDDINVNCGISDKEDVLEYYRFDEDELNTFDKKRVERLTELGYTLKDKSIVKVVTLMDVLNKYNTFDIDFLDIDVEEHEFEVLKGIKFDIVNIKLILVEQLYTDLKGVLDSKIARFLARYGFRPVNKYNRTIIYSRYN